MSEEIALSGTSLRERTAEEIRVLLARRNISAAELGRRTGLKQPYVSRRMTGEVAWDVDDLEKIALALNVEVADLLPRSNEGRVITTVSATNQRSGDVVRRRLRGSTRATGKRRAAHPRPIGRPETGTPAPTPAGPPSQRRPILIGSAG